MPDDNTFPRVRIVNPDNTEAMVGSSVPSSTLLVERANGSGSVASIASAGGSLVRRTIRNIGQSAIEFGPAGVTYGNGHPLPVGESFTFDDTGRYTGNIFCVAAGGAAWATSTVRY